MHFSLPKIYPITDQRISGLTHRDQAEQLAAGGAEILQLREKNMSPRAFFEQAKAVVSAVRDFGVTIIINDRVDFALALNADGVHLGQGDLPPEFARKILGNDAIIGYSTHSVAQAAAALALPIDYIAIGPIFATHSKNGHAEVIGLDGLRAVRRKSGDFPLVAIGGIDRSNILSVLECGADSAAMIGDIVGRDASIAEQMKEFRRITSASQFS